MSRGITGPPLVITVATVSDGRSLAQETRLVKSALLYADHVKLASVVATMIGGMMALRDAGADGVREAMLSALGGLDRSADAVRAMRQLERKRHKTPDEIILIQRLRQQIDAASQKFGEGLDSVIASMEPRELDLAAQHGVLTLEPLGFDEKDVGIDLVLQRLVDIMVATVRPHSTTYPMLDDSTSGLMRAMIADGMVDAPALDPARQVSVAGQFIRELEGFPDAPMDVVLDAREALRKPLGRFRAAVIEIASSLEVSPFEPEFGETAKNLYREHVVPALLELEETARQLHLKEALRRQLGRGTGFRPAAAAVSLGFAAVAQIPELAALAVTGAVGSASKAALDVAAGVMHDRQEIQDRRSQSKFMFLFEAQRLLRS